jgi:exosortase
VELVSLIPCLAACCLAVGGWPLLRWAGPSIGFVLFMMPLPFSVETAISGPLRRVSTLASAFLLQTLGFPAVAEQNIILVDEVQIGVVEACSGVGMIITLFALTTTAAYFCERPPWQKAVIVASTVPIAVFANVLRITLTGVLYELASSDAADLFYHDLAGWIMMPVALVLLWLEFKLLANLFVEVQIDSRLAYDFTGPAPAPHPQPQACVSQNPGS